MAFYIKVSQQVADELGLTATRNHTSDGCVLLWQADLADQPGNTIFARAESVGGIPLTPVEARGEIDGTGPIHPLPQADTPTVIPELEADSPTVIPELQEGGEL